jgi:hypothetical protein
VPIPAAESTGVGLGESMDPRGGCRVEEPQRVTKIAARAPMRDEEFLTS